MAARARPFAALVLVLASLLALAQSARADQAYDKVAAAFAQAGGQLDACAFTRAQLEAALKGIPREVARYVPDLKRAIRDGIATHQRGDCAGRKPGTPTTGAPAEGGAIPPPEVSGTPPSAIATQTTPTTTQPAATAPTTTPAATTPTTTSGAPSRHHDRTPLAIALGALGVLLALALILWGLARLRGWDPPGIARTRHAWREAGYRTTATWSEFTDWLRLGR